MSRAVVIFSGGQDSTTCLFWAKNRFKEVSAISFIYGQKHSIELQQAKKICKDAGIDLKIIDISFLSDISNSALTSNGDINKKNEKGLPASFVPNRNQLFITLAHSFAQKINADNLVTGVCQTDYSGYPDCRQIFIDDLEKVTNYGSDANIKIHTPLIYLTKAETFLLAEKEKCLDIVINDSHTCYSGNREVKYEWGYGCGECTACIKREEGWKEYKSL